MTVANLYLSGETAAYSYAQIDPERVKKVFILGPSHRVYFEECALPQVDKYETPLGSLTLDKEIISKLKVLSSSVRRTVLLASANGSIPVDECED